MLALDNAWQVVYPWLPAHLIRLSTHCSPKPNHYLEWMRTGNCSFGDMCSLVSTGVRDIFCVRLAQLLVLAACQVAPST